jgi:hypothetical protein
MKSVNHGTFRTSPSRTGETERFGHSYKVASNAVAKTIPVGSLPHVNLIAFEPAALAVNAYGPYDDAVPEESVARVRQPTSGFDSRQSLGVSPR